MSAVSTGVRVAVLAILWLAGIALASADESLQPGWSGVLRRGSAEARVEAACDHGSRAHAIHVRMRGLRAGDLYSFWLVTSSAVQGLGAPPYQARAAADGTLTYRASLDTCLSTFELHLRVYEHPPSGSRGLVIDGYVAPVE